MNVLNVQVGRLINETLLRQQWLSITFDRFARRPNKIGCCSVIGVIIALDLSLIHI